MIDLGLVTAYAYAVAGGYEGTEQEFEELLGNIASDLEDIENLTVTATTLPAGSQATASYSNGTLTLGIPRGNTGATGATGQTGPVGPTGNGIASITLTSTVGAVHTYTITYTNGQTTTFDVTDGEVTTASLTATLADYARIDGYYEDLTAGYAENLISNVFEEDSVPYNFRTAGGSLDIGSFENDTVVGGTVAVNQLALVRTASNTSSDVSYVGVQADGKMTFTGTASGNDYIVITESNSLNTVNGHKYLMSGFPASIGNGFLSLTTNTSVRDSGNGTVFNATEMTNARIQLRTVSGVTYNHTIKPQLFDLTQLFGTTIADYIYTLETGNAGAGVAWFKKLFPKSYYPYNAGELMHVQTSGHKTVGFNQWDEEWEVGQYNATTGAKQTNNNKIRNKNFIPVLPNTTYYYLNGSNYACDLFEYDASQNFIVYNFQAQNSTFTTGSNTHYINFSPSSSYGNTYNHDICINLHWDGERDGEYEAYSEHTYPLDSSLVLRGKPTLDSGNNLKYDGDIYNENGTVTRRYGEVDLGSLTYAAYSTDTFYAIITGKKNGYGNIICSKYSTAPQAGVGNLTDKQIVGENGGTAVYIKDSALSGYTTAQVKTAMSGVMLTYELATPTTETADTFQNPQAVSNWGTEEYIDSRTVQIPVGHNTEYPADLKAKVETSPNPPDADGDYIMRRQNGQNMYVALASTSTIQDIISRLEALEA